MSSQCPVSTHIHTMVTARQKERISAPVNRPHMPNDILDNKKVDVGLD